MGIVKQLSLEHFSIESLLDTDAFFVGGYDHIPSLQVTELFRQMKNKIIFFDPGSQRNVEEELEHVDFLFTNEEELEVLQTQLKKFTGTIILKKGAKGCSILNSELEEKQQFATEQVSVVDTTGAGDSFNAGFIHKYIQTKDVEQAVQFANGIGSLCVQQRGATTFSVEDVKK